jgi:WD40 repeat protein
VTVPADFLSHTLREVVLPRYSGRLVIFIDEVDTVRSLPFSTDEFFAGIRECYNQRSEDLELERVTFCLLGVATPSDLILDTRTTPFNIGRRVELHDFTEAEAAPLAFGLGRKVDLSKTLHMRILYWTGGHPYLTQRLCQAVAEDQSVSVGDDVDRLSHELFIAPSARERDDNLLFVREQMLRSQVDLAGLLDLYQRVITPKHVPDDDTNPLVSALRLSGIARVEAGRLVARNRIYKRAFNRKWIADNLPGAEVRRQRQAYRRGVIRTAAISLLALAVVGWLAIIAITQRNRAAQQAEANRRLLYQARMKIAEQEWEKANVERVEEELANAIPQAGEEDLRSFEWYLFKSLTHREVWRLKEDYPIEGAAFLLDGRLFAVSEDVRTITSGASEHLIKIYDLATREALKSYRIQSGNAFEGISFSPDGRRVAVIGPEGTATLCDVLSGKHLVEFGRHVAELSAITLSPDGRSLMTADLKGWVKIWDALTGREKFMLNVPSLVSQAAFSPDDRLLAIVDESSTVRTWDTTTERELPPFEVYQEHLIAAAFFPDGKRLLTATLEGALQIWDVRSRRKISDLPNSPRLQGHSGRITSIAFSQDGGMLATGSADRTALLWPADSGRSLAPIKGHGSSVKVLALSSDALGRRYLITGGRDKNLKLWDVSSGQEPIFPEEKVESFLATAFTTNGDLLAFGIGADKRIKLWNLSTGKEVVRFNKSEEKLLFAVFSPDRKLIATGGTGRSVKLWDTGTGQQIGTLAGHKGGVLGAAFSPDGRQLISGSELNELILWEVATGRELASLTTDVDNGYRAAFSHDGKYLATACRDGRIKLWDFSSRNVISTFSQHTGQIRGMAFSPDNRLLATGAADNLAKLWDVATGKEINTLGPIDTVQRLAFTSDGRRLVTGGKDGMVKLWDVATGHELITLKGHKGEVTSVTFSTDGNSLATSGTDGSLRLWRAAEKQR